LYYPISAFLQWLAQTYLSFNCVLHVFTLHNRQEGIAHEVFQWYLCRMEGWFATDADSISLQGWDQVCFPPDAVVACILACDEIAVHYV
jgi:hypothetical protein